MSEGPVSDQERLRQVAARLGITAVDENALFKTEVLELLERTIDSLMNLSAYTHAGTKYLDCSDPRDPYR